MVITITSDVLGEENNGTTIAAMNLIRYLKSRGHEVRVLCADQDKKGQPGYYVTPNLNLGKILNAYVHKVGVTLAKADKDVIRDALTGADVVHIMLPFGLGTATLKQTKAMGIPVSAGFHMQAEILTSYVKMNKIKPINHFVYKFIYKHFYSQVDRIHYPTQFIQDVFEAHIKKTTPCTVISNGVNNHVQKREVPKPVELQDKIVILTTGRYAREKAQSVLIKAVAKSKYKSQIHLILAGQGVKEKTYRRLAKKLKVDTTFKLYSRQDLIDVLNYADLYVHPAQEELEGIACLEAVQCGKLTIVSDSKLSATKSFAVDEKCIFKHHNPKDLARVIDYWLEHPVEKQACELKYLHSAVDFNQDDCMAKMEKMLVEVAGEKKS